MKKIINIIGIILGLLYAPIYTGGFLLHIFARLLLALAYLLLLDPIKAKYVFSSLFKYYDRYFK